MCGCARSGKEGICRREIRGRYGGDMGEIWGRYGGDMGRYGAPVWATVKPEAVISPTRLYLSRGTALAGDWTSSPCAHGGSVAVVRAALVGRAVGARQVASLREARRRIGREPVPAPPGPRGGTGRASGRARSRRATRSSAAAAGTSTPRPRGSRLPVAPSQPTRPTRRGPSSAIPTGARQPPGSGTWWRTLPCTHEPEPRASWPSVRSRTRPRRQRSTHGSGRSVHHWH